MTELPSLKLGGISLFSDDERSRILEDWNRTRAAFPDGRCLHELIEEQIERTPDAVAVVFGSQGLSYRELDRRVDRLAHHLAASGVEREDLVAVSLRRSTEMVVALLAILRVGAAYVPIDPDYPVDRRAFMLNDCGARLALVTAETEPELPAGRHVVLDSFWWRTLPNTGRPLTRSVDPAQRVYVIYTSGSTGRPKGVANVHRAVVNRLHWMARQYGVTAADTILHKTAFSFDVSVWELFLPLITGARLVLAGPDDHRDPEKLAELICRHRVTLMHFVPSLLELFLEVENVDRCSSLRAVVASGEALSAPLRDRFFERMAPHTELHNLYGPTEAAIDVTHWRCGEVSRDRSVPIGRPVANIQTYVLDERGEPVPVGSEAELLLGGIGLARGYVGRPGLTAERFVPHPFAEGERCYRTGDLARYREDGVLEFRGRIDHQVKLRGYRIELGEIEVVLGDAPGVRRAVVVARPDAIGHQRLVAYVVSAEALPREEARAARIAALREHVAARLPDYMVPGAFVLLDSFPLNASGKVDRARLPAPDPATRSTRQQHVAPRTPLEETLVRLWSGLLSVEQIGIHDDFFEIGGDSIISIQLAARARQEGLPLDVNQVFRMPTVAGLAEFLAARLEKTALTVGEKTFPLTPEQRRALALGADPRRSSTVLLESEEAPDATELKEVLVRLRNRHEALRLRFHRPSEEGGPWTQELLPEGSAVLLRDEPVTGDELPSTAPSPADVGLVAVLGPGREGRHHLLLAVSELAVDARSWPFLVSALEDALGGESIVAPTGVERALREPWPAGGEMPSPATGPEERRRIPVDPRVLDRLAGPAAEAWRASPEELLLAAVAKVLDSGDGEVTAELWQDLRPRAPEGVDLWRAAGRFSGARRVVLPAASDGGPAAAVSLKERLAAPGMEASGSVPDLAVRWLPEWESAGHVPWRPRGSVPVDTAFSAAPVALEVRSGASGCAVEVCWREGAGDGIPERLVSLLPGALADTVEAALQPGSTAYTAVDFPSSGLSTEAIVERFGDRPGVEDVYPLSPMQAGLLFRSLYLPSSDSYLNQNVVEIRGPLDAALLRRAWQAVADHYPILRSGFLWENLEEPLQYVLSSVPLPWTEHDWCNLSTDGQDAALDALLAEDRGQPFELDEAPLLRLHLVRLAANRHFLMWSHHHVLLDGWCLSLIWGNVFVAYRQLAERGEARLPPSRPYRDYVLWLRRQEIGRESESFWKSYLEGFSRVTGFSRSETHFDGAYDTLALSLSSQVTAGLQEMAQRHRVTLNTLVQATWALLLSLYSGSRDVVYGVSVSGRPVEISGVESMVGLFINTLPLRVRIDSGERLADFLHRIFDTMVAVGDHAHVPLARIKSWCEASGSLGRPIFDSLIAYENYPEDKLPEGRVHDLEVHDLLAVEKTEYPMGMIVLPEDRLTFHLNYDTAHFPRSFALRLAHQIETVLADMLARPEARLGEIRTIDDAERHQLLHGWNDTRAHQLPRGVRQLVRERARQDPARAAVVAADGRWTYGELEARAAAVAARLVRAGAGPEQVVAVRADRSAHLVAAVLGIWQAGCVYLPLDPSLPTARLERLLRDAGAVVLIAEELSAVERQGSPGLTALTLRDATEPVPDSAAVDREVAGGQLAYVFYTSGSTGEPKRVGCTHAGISSRVLWSLDRLSATPEDRMLQVAAVGFDISVWEMLLPLAAGSRLVVAPPGMHRDPSGAARLVVEEGVTVAHFVPSLLDPFVRALESRGDNPLRAIACGGEGLSPELRDLVFERIPGVLLDHWYGPTEATISVTAHRCERHIEGETVPIGLPIRGARVHVLDGALEPVPLDVVGELYLGGIALARGYLGRPRETAERFVPDPHGGRGERLYRSGDLARRLPGGELVFVGRADRQVKLRGHRIEPGEVEACLRQHPTVGDALVRVDGEGPAERLVAWVTPTAAGGFQAPDGQGLLAHVRRHLPAPFVPEAVHLLDAFPRTESGKVDVAALPRPERSSPREDSYQPPSSRVEARLVEIWQELLGLERVGVRDSFFDLGGHSLLVITLLARIEQAFGKGSTLNLTDIFKRVTIADLARVLEGHADPRPDTLVPFRPGGDGPPLFLVHPGEGLALAYEPLAAELPGHAVYGINNPRFGDADNAFDSVEEMARCYLGYARAACGEGTLFVGGWSFGGVVAFEMARQLRESGQPVEGVILVDSFNFAAARGIEPVENAVGLLLAARGVDPDSPEGRLLQGEIERSGSLARRYRPQGANVPVVLVRAAEREEDELTVAVGPVNGWDRVPGCDPVVVDVPGRHEELFSPGALPAVVAAVRDALASMALGEAVR